VKKLALGLLSLAATVHAQAADIPIPDSAPVKSPVFITYNWSGLYIGGNAGYSWGLSSADITSSIAGGTVSGSRGMNGWVGGAQIGLNMQTGAIVLGLEADIQATGQKASETATCAPGVCVAGTTLNASFEQKLPWFATVRGRLGWTVMPTALLYVTGGLAVGEVKTSGTLTATLPPTVTSASGSSSTIKIGWTVGAGVEAALGGSNWTVKIEYLYVDLGSDSTTVTAALPAPPPASVSVTSNLRFTDHIARAGLNYRF
jgi:outer membrane immunogenic protein